MEWLEMQRLMGVDHVQLMAVSGPEHVQRVVGYYRDTGLLNVVSYRQPGQRLVLVSPLSDCQVMNRPGVRVGVGGGERTQNSELYYSRIEILGSSLFLQSVLAVLHRQHI